MIVIISVVILAVYIGAGYLLFKSMKKINEEKNRKKNERLIKILRNFTIGLFILFLFFIFFQPELMIWGFCILGAFTIEEGVILFILEKNNKEDKDGKKLGIFISIAGLITIIISVIVYVMPPLDMGDVSVTVPLLGLITMELIGLGMVYFGIKGLKPPKGCTVEVSATCINLLHAYLNNTDIDGRFRSDIVYCPVYEYSYNGVKYTESDDVYTVRGKCPNEGETVLIKINPDNPSLFWDGKRQIYISILSIIAGAWFVILSSIVLTLVLR
jgi:uncharacterized membrane protein HdeD (DUF308 family)